MANVTISIPNPDVPDALAALEQRFKSEAINMYFSGSPAGYDALSDANKGKALIGAFLTLLMRNYRKQQAEAAISVTDPVIT